MELLDIWVGLLFLIGIYAIKVKDEKFDKDKTDYSKKNNQ